MYYFSTNKVYISSRISAGSFSSLSVETQNHKGGYINDWKHPKPLTIMLNIINTEIKKNVSMSLYWILHHIQRIYKLFWYEISLDPSAVVNSHEVDHKNEVKLDVRKIYYIRALRLYFVILHIIVVRALYSCMMGQVKVLTVLFTWLLFGMALLGTTAGSHRLWCHRSYKATWQLRVILVFFQTLCNHYSIYNWVRDHRLHHKYSDTEYDPHNVNRGFFFSHIGWIVTLRAPEAKRKLKNIPMNDIEKDKIVMFQKRHYVLMTALLIFIPPIIPWYFWNENFITSFTFTFYVKCCLVSHCVFLVNSAAHMWGMKPYDRNIKPVENKLVSIFAFGEGWHNYHHMFPWDYKTSELGSYKLNVTTAFIDLCAKIGWAYDLKTVSSDIIAEKVKSSGDGSHLFWDWNDVNLRPDVREVTEIKHRKSNNEIRK